MITGGRHYATLAAMTEDAAFSAKPVFSVFNAALTPLVNLPGY
ncbi:hypothetical protein GEOBRER4_n0761 [Citrifermentans bremense]|uniref:Uncharacterized protein n=1 Tax=Citrifermentans bremense TaxID=60035 RepID=A0A7R7J013_9BACT|nr:hypothetical protein GEOBRER4_n0761 [Citrifermentans bremense]